MASPVKNFQDPSGISRMSPSRPAAAFPKIHTPSQLAVAMVNPLDTRIFLVAAEKRVLSMAIKMVKIPPPPMGRMFVATFPPIYRERGGSNRPQDGQVWPRLVEGS